MREDRQEREEKAQQASRWWRWKMFEAEVEHMRTMVGRQPGWGRRKSRGTRAA